MAVPHSLFPAPADKLFSRAIARGNAAKPFFPERNDAERDALGAEFVEKGAEWNTRPPASESHPNLAAITARCAALLARLKKTWPRDGKVSQDDADLYEEVAGYWLYQEYAAHFDRVILSALE